MPTYSTILGSELETRIRQATDTVTKPKPSSNEIVTFLNAAGKELNYLMASAAQDHMITHTTLVVTSSVYPSASLPNNFKSLSLIETNRGTQTYNLNPFTIQQRSQVRDYSPAEVPMYRTFGQEIEFLPATAASGTYDLWYEYSWAAMTTGSYLEQIYEPYTDYIVNSAAEKVILSLGNRQGEAGYFGKLKQETAAQVREECSKRDNTGKVKTTSNRTVLSDLGEARYLGMGPRIGTW